MLSRPWPTTFEQTVPHNFELRGKQLFCAYMQKQIPVRSRCSTFLQAAKLLSEVKAEKAALELQKQVCSSTHMSATCVHLLYAFHTHVCFLCAFTATGHCDKVCETCGVYLLQKIVLHFSSGNLRF